MTQIAVIADERATAVTHIHTHTHTHINNKGSGRIGKYLPDGTPAYAHGHPTTTAHTHTHTCTGVRTESYPSKVIYVCTHIQGDKRYNLHLSIYAYMYMHCNILLLLMLVSLLLLQQFLSTQLMFTATATNSRNSCCLLHVCVSACCYSFCCWYFYYNF